jgi:hypothetical protein
MMVERFASYKFTGWDVWEGKVPASGGSDDKIFTLPPKNTLKIQIFL